MFSSKSSSASAGVMPKPAAEFSPLAMTRSMASSRTMPGRRSLTMVRPGRPKMSPMKRIRMFTLNFDGNTGRLRLRSVPRGSEFGGAQEVVIARGIQLQIADAFVVYQNVVEVPKIDVGQFVGQYDLQFGIG